MNTGEIYERLKRVDEKGGFPDFITSLAAISRALLNVGYTLTAFTDRILLAIDFDVVLKEQFKVEVKEFHEYFHYGTIKYSIKGKELSVIFNYGEDISRLKEYDSHRERFLKRIERVGLRTFLNYEKDSPFSFSFVVDKLTGDNISNLNNKFEIVDKFLYKNYEPSILHALGSTITFKYTWKDKDMSIV